MATGDFNPSLCGADRDSQFFGLGEQWAQNTMGDGKTIDLSKVGTPDQDQDETKGDLAVVQLYKALTGGADREGGVAQCPGSRYERADWMNQAKVSFFAGIEQTVHEKNSAAADYKSQLSGLAQINQRLDQVRIDSQMKLATFTQKFNYPIMTTAALLVGWAIVVTFGKESRAIANREVGELLKEWETLPAMAFLGVTGQQALRTVAPSTEYDTAQEARIVDSVGAGGSFGIGLVAVFRGMDTDVRNGKVSKPGWMWTRIAMATLFGFFLSDGINEAVSPTPSGVTVNQRTAPTSP
jgi:hypothetical protein